MVLISNTPSRTYKPADLRLAEALADRAALALENGRLYQTALRATRLRDEVLGIVAHDLRNPVASIMMMTTGLKRAEGEAGQRSEKARAGILRAANRMNRLIGDLLDVTLVEAGQLAVQCERLSTRQLVMDSIEVQRPLASSASIELHLQLPDDVPDIWGDQHRVLQVLDNLVGNGIKFTPVEGRITVGAAPRDGEVLFWVADTGAGISSGRSPPRLRPLLARTEGHPSRRGPRPGDQPRNRRGARGKDLGGEQVGARTNLLLHPPPVGRRGRATLDAGGPLARPFAAEVVRRPPQSGSGLTLRTGSSRGKLMWKVALGIVLFLQAGTTRRADQARRERGDRGAYRLPGGLDGRGLHRGRGRRPGDADVTRRPPR